MKKVFLIRGRVSMITYFGVVVAAAALIIAFGGDNALPAFASGGAGTGSSLFSLLVSLAE